MTLGLRRSCPRTCSAHTRIPRLRVKRTKQHSQRQLSFSSKLYARDVTHTARSTSGSYLPTLPGGPRTEHSLVGESK